MENNFWKILSAYKSGWKDSGDCRTAPYIAPKMYEDNLLQLAYETGWNDYIIGDDISSIDLQTNKQIVDKIRKKFNE